MSAIPGIHPTELAARRPPTIGTDLLARLERLETENQSLRGELLRCYEQLSIVYEFTQHGSAAQDPNTLREVLLRRFAAMLGAGAVYWGNRVELRRVSGPRTSGRPVAIGGAKLAAVLARHLASTVTDRRSRVPALSAAEVAALGGAHVLMGALHNWAAEADVVVALRSPGEAPFDAGDIVAAESVLGYGGQILSNLQLVQKLQQMGVQTVCALANAIDAKDNYTSGHSGRVSWLARLTAESLGLSPRELQSIEWAGLLHDVGKIGVSERILNKPGQLTPDELEEIRRHPQIGFQLLSPIEGFAPVLDAVLYHHENHDGSGYPTGLAGAAIPLAARIIHVVDIFDALTTTRPYRKRYSLQQAFECLRRDAGRVTDPQITEVFIAAFEKYRANHAADFVAHFGCPDTEIDPAEAAPGLPGAWEVSDET